MLFNQIKVIKLPLFFLTWENHQFIPPSYAERVCSMNPLLHDIFLFNNVFP